MHGGGVEGPEPSAPAGVAQAGEAGAELPDGEGGGGAEDAVDGEQDPGGGCRVDAEKLEDGGHEERVKGREPGCGAGVGEDGVAEGVCVAEAGDEGAGDAAGFEAEGEVVFERLDAPGVGERHVGEAEDEGDQKRRAGAMVPSSGRAKKARRRGGMGFSLVDGVWDRTETWTGVGAGVAISKTQVSEGET